MELTVIIPTRDRCAVLSEALDRLEAQAGDAEFEVFIVDDGSSDDTLTMLEQKAAHSGLTLTAVRQERRGPAAARNRALASARAPVCLFLNDDSWAAPGLVARHRDFHARHPEQEAALLGHVVPMADPSPFTSWVNDVLFGFSRIDTPDDAGGENFFSLNVSAKTRFVRDAGSFDERFDSAAHEDIDLGVRLEARGMRLVYDREAVVEHHHPLDLPATLARMQTSGRALARFKVRHPERPVPRRPDARHRLKAAALTILALLRIRPGAVQRETWRFLCEEANREAYWDAVDGRDAAPEPVRIGATLARLASADCAAHPVGASPSGRPAIAP